MKIIVKVDFTMYPGGRRRLHGPGSGEEFRESLLEPALDRNEKIIVDLDGLAALPPSFIDESLGVLLRKLGKEKFDQIIEVILTDDPDAIELYENIRTESPK